MAQISIISFGSIKDTSKQKELKYSYLIATKNGNLHTKTKTKSIAEVYTMAEVVLPGNCIDFKNHFKYQKYFEIRTDKKEIYIEKKKLKK